MTHIGSEAFSGCHSLTEVTFPAGLTLIRRRLMKGCGSLRRVCIQNGVTRIGPEAFCGCRKIFSLTVPESVSECDASAFAGCVNMADITIRGNKLEWEIFTALWAERDIQPEQIVHVLTDYPNTPPDEAENFWAIPLEMYRFHPDDRRNTAYLRAHIADALCFLIDQGDIALVQKMLQSGQFDAALRNSIDGCIEYAIEQCAYELQVILTNHKEEKTGFTDAAEQFQL